MADDGMVEGDYNDDDLMYEWEYVEEAFPLAVSAFVGRFWFSFGWLQRASPSDLSLRQIIHASHGHSEKQRR